MKTAGLLLLGFLFTASVHGQGVIVFANATTPDSRILTNLNGGNFGYMSGASAYRIGLYIGPLGSTESDLTLGGIATNATGLFSGLFNGGNPYRLPAGFAPEVPIAFQIRVWTFSCGLTYEQASSAPGPCFLGESAIGYVTPGDINGGTPGILFGTAPGQLYGLQVPPSGGQFGSLAIATTVPEPSTFVLGALGLLALGFLGRKAR
jgi:hypothetical protein